MLFDAEVQGILPRTVTTSNFDLGNGSYNLVLTSLGLWLEVKFGKGGKVVGKAKNAGATPEESPAEASEGSGEESSEPASGT